MHPKGLFVTDNPTATSRNLYSIRFWRYLVGRIAPQEASLRAYDLRAACSPLPHACRLHNLAALLKKRSDASVESEVPETAQELVP